MSSAVRCDVCRTISDAILPPGWKAVTPIGGIQVMASHVCEECWDFLVHGRGEE